uniref:Uncharacterized protein n=1 Tax=Sphaerodactylus townsendi TaxID=933632 RepID=A0ACB8EGW0_9SAUR
MLRGVRWGFFCKRGGSRAPFSARAWYQMPLKEGDSEKPLADGSGGVSILGPKRPLGQKDLINLLAASVVHRDGLVSACAEVEQLGPRASGAVFPLYFLCLLVNTPPPAQVKERLWLSANPLAYLYQVGKPDSMTLLSLLPALSQKLGLSQDAQVIKAPGKESSGLVLLSDCQSTVQHFQKFYIKSLRARRPAATYCAVTTRLPADSEGEISTGLQLIHKEDSELVRKALMGKAKIQRSLLLLNGGGRLLQFMYRGVLCKAKGWYFLLGWRAVGITWALVSCCCCRGLAGNALSHGAVCGLQVVPVASPSRGTLWRKEVKNTRTRYRVLDSQDRCALVELQPLTSMAQRCSATEQVLQS